MNKLRRFCCCVLLIAILLPSAGSVSVTASSAPSRAINVVYDDSGSMFRENNVLLTRWSQAKYAAEVFAAMLGERDTMSLYLMSDFDRSTPIRTPRLRLNGSDGASRNVSEIHNMLSEQNPGTPFEPVRQAYADLSGVTATEKWLVILTDGQFANMSNSQVNAFLQSKSSDVKVCFIAIGEDAAAITQDTANNIFFGHARNGPELLDIMTDMCTRVFNFNKLRVSASALNFEFDIPMYELTVFAQGQDVNITGIIDSSGQLIAGGAPVNVRYSTQPTLDQRYAAAPYDPSLNGYIAEFQNEFPAGNYALSVSGANTVEIYYKPDVDIDIFLTDDSGQVVSTRSADAGEYTVEAGEYTLNFSFEKRGTNTRLPPSSLLGDVTYTAGIVSNGVPHNRTYTQGDRIALEDGSHRIDATAVYLDYNTVTTALVVKTIKNEAIDFDLDGAGGASYL